MKKELILVIMMTSLTALANGNGQVGSVGRLQKCGTQALAAIQKQVQTMRATNIIGLLDVIQLKGHDETYFYQAEVFNSGNEPVEISLYRLNTGGLVHKVAVKTKLRNCQVISVSEHGQVE